MSITADCHSVEPSASLGTGVNMNPYDGYVLSYDEGVIVKWYNQWFGTISSEFDSQ